MLGAAEHRQQAGATLVASATHVAPPQTPPAMQHQGEASMGDHTVGGEQTSRLPPKLAS
jgi:hypothetical protein